MTKIYEYEILDQHNAKILKTKITKTNNSNNIINKDNNNSNDFQDLMWHVKEIGSRTFLLLF